MRRMENYAYRRWNKMWHLWKFNKIDSPFDELVTYDNCMTFGHLYYFKLLNTDINIRRNMFVLKEFITKDMYDNLDKAYKIYLNNLDTIDSGKLIEL